MSLSLERTTSAWTETKKSPAARQILMARDVRTIRHEDHRALRTSKESAPCLVDSGPNHGTGFHSLALIPRSIRE